MGFAVRSLDSAMAPDWGDVVPVHSQRRRADRIAELPAAVAVVRGALESVVPVAGRGGAAGVSHRLSGNSLLRPRRRAGLHLRQRRRRASSPAAAPSRTTGTTCEADLDLATVIAETVGWVHRGFKREVDDLWPRLEQALREQHAARCGSPATRSAARWRRSAPAAASLSYIRSNPRALFTYGSPRVGNRRYVNYVQMRSLSLGEQQRHRHARAAGVARLSAQRAGSVPQRLRQDSPAHRLAAGERPLARIRPRAARTASSITSPTTRSRDTSSTSGRR